MAARPAGRHPATEYDCHPQDGAQIHTGPRRVHQPAGEFAPPAPPRPSELAPGDRDRRAVCRVLCRAKAWPVLRLLNSRTCTVAELHDLAGADPTLIEQFVAQDLITDPVAADVVNLTPRGRLVWAGLRGL